MSGCGAACLLALDVLSLTLLLCYYCDRLEIGTKKFLFSIANESYNY